MFSRASLYLVAAAAVAGGVAIIAATAYNIAGVFVILAGLVAAACVYESGR